MSENKNNKNNKKNKNSNRNSENNNNQNERTNNNCLIYRNIINQTGLGDLFISKGFKQSNTIL